MVWAEIEALLLSWPLYPNRRAEIDGFGVVMGSVIPKGTKQTAVHSATFEYAASVKRLIQLLKRLHIVDDQFLFSCIQLLMRATVAPHSDPNPTDSIIFMCGNFSGGLFRVRDETIDLWRKPLRFDGSVEHSVEPFSGDRLSVAIYLHRKHA